MGEVALDAVVVRSQLQADCEIEGESVVMSLEREEFYALNTTASEIWRLTEEPTTVAAIVDDLLSRYRVDAVTCVREVCELIDRMSRFGILDADPPRHDDPHDDPPT
jgi:hypothetical protein